MVAANIEIQASSLNEAIQLAYDASLPDDGDYTDGSFEVNAECAEYENEHLEEIIKIDNAEIKDYPLLLNSLKTKAGKDYLEKKLKEI